MRTALRLCALSSIVLGLAPAQALAGPTYPTANDDPTPLGMHSAPRVGTPIGSVPAGASVEVLCQTRGQSLSDPKYGRTSLWDKVAYGGKVGYVTDLYVLTNVDRIAGVPDCGGAAAPAPAPAPDPAPAPAPADGPAATPGGAISRDEIMRRSADWVARGIMYSTKRWTDGYRQDCSGFVSMSWKLTSAPTSKTLRTSRYTSVIDRAALAPGDALYEPGHIAIFVRWADGGRAVVREEYLPGRPASERTWSARRVGGETALRYRNVR